MRGDVLLELSRLDAAVRALGATASEPAGLYGKRVLLTGEREGLQTANGRVMLLTALRLLARIGVSLTVVIPDELPVLQDEIRREVSRIGAQCMVVGRTETAFDASLGIGGRGMEGPHTTISSNGWLARVSSTPLSEAVAMDVANPIAATTAAALGVTEIVKRLWHVREERGAMADNLTFSLYSYRTDDPSLGPALPSSLSVDWLLIGFGAIGNAIGHVIRELPLDGHLGVVDRQSFGPENFGTCMLIRREDIEAPKADVAKVLLSSGQLTVHAMTLDVLDAGDLDELARRLRMPCIPSIVLGALDSAEARRSVQLLWPELLIDGAIGDFMCQVSRHPADPSIAVGCLRCRQVPSSAASAEQLAASATGLSVDRVQDGNDVVTEADVDAAPVEKREFLRTHKGKPICSVVSVGTIRSITDAAEVDQFDPSTPFVACISGAFVVSEAVKAVMGGASPLAPAWQMDTLAGPQHGSELSQGRKSSCECVRYASVVDEIRNERRQAMLESDGIMEER